MIEQNDHVKRLGLPEAGQLVSVRNRQWIVSNINSANASKGNL